MCSNQTKRYTNEELEVAIEVNDEETDKFP